MSEKDHNKHTDYYVYLHKRATTGEVFYVGKGRLKRAECLAHSARTGKWIAESVAHGVVVEYYATNLTNEEAYRLEKEAYDKYKHCRLVNAKKVGDERLDYSSVNWSDMLYYDETSPTCLRWKVANLARNPASRRLPGDQAGSLRKVGGKLVHGQIKIRQKSYAIHRVVWCLVNGSIPAGFVINHIDCDPTNNVISNLELCTMSGNANKKKCHKKKTVEGNTKSGYYFIKEVTCHATGIPVTQAVFYLKDGTLKSKTFRHNVYPRDIAIEFAIMWRESMFDEYFDK